VSAKGHDSREGDANGVRSREATTTERPAGEEAQWWSGLTTLADEADEGAVK
jgi:hypothetical protein